LVGARGFEPPTSWSRTRRTKRINNLAVGIGVDMDFDRLFQLNNLYLITSSIVDTGNNASMRGVGIVLGIDLKLPRSGFSI